MRIGMDIGADTIKTVIVRNDGSVEELPILSVQGQPLKRVEEAIEKVLETIRSVMPDPQVIVGLTGTGAESACLLIAAEKIDETSALAASIELLYPDVRTIVEMGREGQKYLLFEQDEASGRLLLVDANLGNKCAAGSGSFLDYMAKRLNFESIEEFAQVALKTENPASLSGRCSVFTESDIVHLYQKGTPRERIAAGVHQAICRNYRSCFARGKQFNDRVAFIGGVSENPAVIKYLSEELNLDGRLFVPKHNRTLGAIGAALRASKLVNLTEALPQLEQAINRTLEYASTGPIQLVESVILPPLPTEEIPPKIATAALGVDIGSVSTKAALVTEIDGKCHVLASYYRRTDGDPLAAVRDTIGQIQRQIEEKGYEIGQVFAATTGSGRYLTGDYIGADLVKNEITAQANAALTLVPGADTIIEIGGQDSKSIWISGKVITDFEMNKACAAGCGAFLEKQAARLDIEIGQFGDYALRGTKPPDLDWTCTVFTESAMFYYQQSGIPLEDLCSAVCLATVKNYLSKNVGGRKIGDNVVFQGAVALNKGMVAAFETVLGRKITVPPYPQLTGAIGVARLALRERPEKSRFRGFGKIAESSYDMRSRECKGCPNACDINIFTMGDGMRYFYNDRCEKYSGPQKNKLGGDLPNLFEERERMLLTVYQKKAPAGAPRVGIPRGLMFADYFPLFNAFFTELGFEVVPSEPTSKQTIERGLAASIGEPCFPYKVAHGHYIELAEKEVDYIFAPAFLSTEQPNPNLKFAQTCPYLQAAPEVIATCTAVKAKGIKYLAPRLHFIRGKKHLEHAFRAIAQEIGKTPKEAKQALEVGLEALARFRIWQSDRGREVLNSLSGGQVAYVIVGRPYSLYDEAVNMSIGKKVQELGILAIPQDFLPLEGVDIADYWKEAYSRQIQKKLAAARIIRQDVRLRAIVLTYFGCGPDSFANPFFKDELGEPCYVMQIDEHTADAGVITRLEAFSDTIVADKQINVSSAIRPEEESIRQIQSSGKRLWIPYASESARILAAVFQAYGIDAAILPRSLDAGLNRARAAIAEDVCLPALMTTEDILYRVEQSDFEPSRECFFQGNSNGPCRFGMYYMLQCQILHKLGLSDTHMTTLGIKSEHGGLGLLFSMVAWDSFVVHDLLQKMLHRSRPYEANPGQSDTLFARYIDAVCAMIPSHKRRVQDGLGIARSLLSTSHLEPFKELLSQAQIDFAAIPQQRTKRPLVGVVGEFFVRIHDGANQDIIRKIEGHGGEAWLAPATEFFSYANYIGMVLAKEWWRETGDKEQRNLIVAKWFNHHLARRDEEALWQATLPYLKDYPDIGSEELVREGSKYLHHTFGGEAICSLGKGEDFARRRLDGIVSVIPFNCMPGNIVSALSQALRRQHNNIPFLNLDYDGFVDASRDAKLANFMWQVKER